MGSAVHQSYNPKAGYCVTVLRWNTSVVPSVLGRMEFWLFMFLHLATYVAYKLGYLSTAHEQYHHLHMPSFDMKIVSAITTFFEVFYTNQCYQRYLQLYSLTRKMLGSAYDLCFVMRLYIRHSSSDVAALYDRIASRWVVVSLLLFIFELKTGEPATEEEWLKLKKLGLARAEEIEFLRNLTPEQRLLVMLHSCADLCKTGTTMVRAPNNYLKDIVAKILTYREAQQQVINTMNLPIPFEYFHLLNMMVIMNCLVWAYYMGVTESWFAPPCYFCAVLIFMGMMDLASQLSNPFGCDQVDFPVNDWMAEFLQNMSALLDYEQDGTSDELAQELKELMDAKSLIIDRDQVVQFFDEDE
jgi:predicted membrane chloride channel (bestrophin family)